MCEVEARGSGGGVCPGKSGGMPSAKRALATLGEGAGGGGASWVGVGGAGASPVAMPELPGGGNLDWDMGSSTRKVMLHPNVIGELKELALFAAVSTRKPACLRWVQDQASGDTAHDILCRDVSIVLFVPDGLRDLFKAVVGDTGLDVVADYFSPGQSPLCIRTVSSPSVHGCCHSLRYRLCNMVVALRSLARGSPLKPFCHSQHRVYRPL